VTGARTTLADATEPASGGRTDLRTGAAALGVAFVRAFAHWDIEAIQYLARLVGVLLGRVEHWVSHPVKAL
jgi:hypothetical protein